jgi:FkbM family methyltransferase
MSSHHKVFSRFRPFSGEVPAFTSADFLGTKVRHEFVAGFGPPCPQVTKVENCYPAFDEEYFEWIDLLESVVAAEKSYTMIELGAGFGRWVVRAAHAVQQYNDQLPYHLIAVEAEPVVFQWMRRHFRDNAIDPSKHRLVHAAVSHVSGDMLFYIGGPRGGPFDRHPSAWYGQCLTKGDDLSSESEKDGEYCGLEVLRHKSGWRSIRVPSISLASILKDLSLVDLVDMDIEGQELPTIDATIKDLNTKVKRLHIGTHGKEIESDLRQLLSSHRWRCGADYSLFSASETPWGLIHFENGVQSWVNPRFC